MIAGRPPIDLSGIRVGRLTILHREERGTVVHVRWVAQCDCGKRIRRQGRHLRDAIENGWNSACRSCLEIGRRGRGGCCRLCGISGHDQRRCPDRKTVVPRFCETCWEQSWRRPLSGCPECGEPYAEEAKPNAASRLEFPHDDRTVTPA